MVDEVEVIEELSVGVKGVTTGKLVELTALIDVVVARFEEVLGPKPLELVGLEELAASVEDEFTKTPTELLAMNVLAGVIAKLVELTAETEIEDEEEEGDDPTGLLEADVEETRVDWFMDEFGETAVDKLLVIVVADVLAIALDELEGEDETEDEVVKPEETAAEGTIAAAVLELTEVVLAEILELADTDALAD